ncbi:hypothetical protein AMQ83_14145 [Paenibacillus riograndensis]|nr:hypothetical protein AMQ83_14145 [Paenibacillus riograndensis]
MDFDVFQKACHFYALVWLCDSPRSYTDWQATLQGRPSRPINQVQPGQVAAHLRAYADAYLNTGITADCPAEYSSSFMLAANTLPIHRIRFSLFLRLLNR